MKLVVLLCECVSEVIETDGRVLGNEGTEALVSRLLLLFTVEFFVNACCAFVVCTFLLEDSVSIILGPFVSEDSILENFNLSLHTMESLLLSSLQRSNCRLTFNLNTGEVFSGDGFMAFSSAAVSSIIVDDSTSVRGV